MKSEGSSVTKVAAASSVTKGAAASNTAFLLSIKRRKPLAGRGLPALWKSRSDTLPPQCRAQRARRLLKAAHAPVMRDSGAVRSALCGRDWAILLNFYLAKRPKVGREAISLN